MSKITMTIDELAQHMKRDRELLASLIKRHERRFRVGAEVETQEVRNDNVLSRKLLFTNRGIIMMMKLVDQNENKENGAFTVLANCLEGRYEHSDFANM